jgi:hypothetical protein
VFWNASFKFIIFYRINCSIFVNQLENNLPDKIVPLLEFLVPLDEPEPGNLVAVPNLGNQVYEVTDLPRPIG